MQRTKAPARANNRGKPGPKSGCTPEKIEQAYKFCLLGLTDWQIATHFGISQDTFSYWLKTRPEFKEAVEQGRQYADAEVAKMLYKVGMGEVEQEAVKFFKIPYEEEFLDDQGNVVKRVKTQKIVPQHYTKRFQPDTKALIKWLGVRNRETWGESLKVQHDHRHAHLVGGEIDVSMIQDQLSDQTRFSEEELKALTKLGLSELAESQAQQVRQAGDHQ